MIIIIMVKNPSTGLKFPGAPGLKTAPKQNHEPFQKQGQSRVVIRKVGLPRN